MAVDQLLQADIFRKDVDNVSGINQGNDSLAKIRPANIFVRPRIKDECVSSDPSDGFICGNDLPGKMPPEVTVEQPAGDHVDLFS